MGGVITPIYRAHCEAGGGGGELFFDLLGSGSFDGLRYARSAYSDYRGNWEGDAETLSITGRVTVAEAHSPSLGNADPAEVLADLVAALNDGDVDAMMEFFTEDSIVNAHPLADNLRGLDSIRRLTVDAIAESGSTNIYEISNVAVTGDTVTWDYTWINDGVCYQNVGAIAVIRNGKMLTWTWPKRPERDFYCR